MQDLAKRRSSPELEGRLGRRAHQSFYRWDEAVEERNILASMAAVLEQDNEISEGDKDGGQRQGREAVVGENISDSQEVGTVYGGDVVFPSSSSWGRWS